MILILAGSAIVALAQNVNEHSWGWDADGVHFPKSAGVTGVAEVETVPAGFDPGYCTWDGEAVICLPPASPPPPRWEVRKLAIIERIGPDAYPAFAAALSQLTDYQRARWDSARSINSDDPDAIALLTAIGQDPAAVLAPDPDL